MYRSQIGLKVKIRQSGSVLEHIVYGLFTLHGNGTRTGAENVTSTIGNNGFWSLSLSQTSVNISTWYCTFLLVYVPAHVPYSCSVNIPQVRSSFGRP